MPPRNSWGCCSGRGRPTPALPPTTWRRWTARGSSARSPPACSPLSPARTVRGVPLPFSPLASTGTSGSASATPVRRRSRPSAPRSGRGGSGRGHPVRGSERGPPGNRPPVRRALPHPGAQLTFTDVHGYRYQLCLTNLPTADLPYLEALYRGRGRGEQTLRALKATGLAPRPSAYFALNPAWLTAVRLAGDRLAWFRRRCLTGRWRQMTSRVSLAVSIGRSRVDHYDGIRKWSDGLEGSPALPAAPASVDAGGVSSVGRG